MVNVNYHYRMWINEATKKSLKQGMVIWFEKKTKISWIKIIFSGHFLYRLKSKKIISKLLLIINFMVDVFVAFISILELSLSSLNSRIYIQAPQKLRHISNIIRSINKFYDKCAIIIPQITNQWWCFISTCKRDR